ncbi:UNVERIFIED_CONTAM: hypothetical protein PYX00_011294 [Menopon gallinae]|uniref:Midasin n=1 Tax=Menopon gallinae TaxID=328185 RepID=A0AAW2H7A4_9NEOP
MDNDACAACVEDYGTQRELLEVLVRIGITPVVCGEFGRTRFIMTCFPQAQFKIIDAREIDELKSLERSYELVDGFLHEGPGLVASEWVIIRNVDYNLSVVPVIRQYKGKFFFTARKGISMKNCQNMHLTYGRMLVDTLFADSHVRALVGNMFGDIDRRVFNMLLRLHKRLRDVNGMTLENRLKVYHAIKVVCLSHAERGESAGREEALREALCLSGQAVVQYEDTVFDYAGDTGSGKTSLVEYVAKSVHGRGLWIINLSSDTEVSDLVGSYQVVGDCRGGGDCSTVRFEFREGMFSRALRSGEWVLLDEINLAPREVLDFLDAKLESCSTPVFGCMNAGDVGKKEYEGLGFTKIAVSSDLCASDLNEMCSLYGQEMHLEALSGVKCNKRELVRVLEMLRTGFDAYSVFRLVFNDRAPETPRARASKGTKAAKHMQSAGSIHGYVVTEQLQEVVDSVELAIKGALPVLLQGETSTGKTSLVRALAARHGVRLVRINNHEHTEASDYFGSYGALGPREIRQSRSAEHAEGAVRIGFREGLLASAIREGHWVLLDELNLAPSDVLEVLNRVLDRKGFFCPLRHVTVPPHPMFRIFATQNLGYAGRKMLSRALKSRFVVLSLAPKDEGEMATILSAFLPKSFVKKMIGVYLGLRLERNFDQLVTLRDLFRWGGRRLETVGDVCNEGLMLLRERLRTDSDRSVVDRVFTHVFGTGAIDAYERSLVERFEQMAGRAGAALDSGFMFTASFKRLLVLLVSAWNSKEPVLLVGDTGTGKSRMVEAAALLIQRPTVTISMHGSADNTDFVGAHSFSGGVKWKDGPLLRAMRKGAVLIIDEINLAEASVLERLNSVLERERELVVPEIGEEIRASEHFLVAACMNPGDDAGKKELSAALRNRFTEIYFEVGEREVKELAIMLLDAKFRFLSSSGGCSQGKPAEHDIRRTENLLGCFRQEFRESQALSVRRMELVVDFICRKVFGGFEGIIHGEDTMDPREVFQEAVSLDSFYRGGTLVDDCMLGVHPYYIPKVGTASFNFRTPTMQRNLLRILRALGMKRGVMLEGEPGTGKTSIITSIAKVIGKKALRINLSDQTEFSDLTGTYLPTQAGIEFVKGPMIRYLEEGHWVILDEVNLCSQSVIEGLNSILDFRGTLDTTEFFFRLHAESRIFCTLNPADRSNRRKTLPGSFVDRFIKIEVESLNETDIRMILEGMFPNPVVLPTLREAIKVNMIGRNYYLKERVSYLCSTDMQGPDAEHCAVQGRPGHVMKIGMASLHPADTERYVVIHSHVGSLETLARCYSLRLPAILTGFGALCALEFVSSSPAVEIQLHRESDVSDILGQYVKTRANAFEWEDSKLVASLKKGHTVVLRNPEQVEKCILDRLNSLFEGERTLLLHEKGVDMDVRIHPDAFLALLCDDLDLSPALVDRCVVIRFSSVLNWIDIQKLFFAAKARTCREAARRIRVQAERMSLSEKAELLCTDVPDIETLELDLRKFSALDILPGYLSGMLPNVLDEVHIRGLFRTPPLALDSSELAVRNDASYSEVVGLYREIAMEFEPLSTDEEKVRRLSGLCRFTGVQRTLVFLKHSNLSFVSKCPRSVKELKIFFIRSFRGRTLGDYRTLHLLCDLFARLKETTLDFSFNPRLFRLEIDPRRTFYVHKKEQLIEFYNRESRRLEDIFVDFYKYGVSPECGETVSPSDAYSAFRRSVHKMELEMQRLSTSRDYRGFVSNLGSYNFKTELPEFDDLLTYYKVHMLEERVQRCEPCGNDTVSSEVLSLMLIREGVSHVLRKVELDALGFEFCKAFYMREVHGKIPRDSLGRLIFEMLCMSREVPLAPGSRWESVGLAAEEVLTDRELTLCLKSIFPAHMSIRLFNRNERRIFLTREYVDNFDISEHLDKSIFSYPEDIVTDRRVKKSLYSCADTVVDYKMFIPLVLFDFSIDLLRRYLLDTNISEFLHRLSFMESFVCMENRGTGIEKTTKVYNVSLQYKIFEIAKQQAQIRERSRIKAFLVQETCSQLRSVTFSEPDANKDSACPLTHGDCERHAREYYQVPVSGITCSQRCLSLYADVLGEISKLSPKEGTGLQLLDLATGLDQWQKHILAAVNSFKVPQVTREEILSLYYARLPRSCYSAEEIGVAKVVYLATVHELETPILFLVLCVLHCPSVQFAYLLFKLINAVYREDVSGGGTLKSGVREGAEPVPSADDAESKERQDSSGDESEDGHSESACEGDFNENQSEDASCYAEPESSGEEDLHHDSATSSERPDETLCSEPLGSEAGASNTEEDCTEASGECSEGNSDMVDSGGECSGKSEDCMEAGACDEESRDADVADEPQPLQALAEYSAGQAEENNEQLCEEAENYVSRVLDRERDGEIMAERDVEEDAVLSMKQERVRARELFCLLRNILEENKRGKYRGDFKSGKKLNMKRIAAFVASGYRRDKIWMKRARNAKREYAIRLFIDNSKSMARYDIVDRLSLIYSHLESAFGMLEIRLELFRFGRTCVETALGDLDFKDLETNIDWITSYRTGVNLVLTDGVFQTPVYSQNTLLLLIDRHGIREMKKVVLKDGLLVTRRYLDTLEMRYCVLDDLGCLESHFVAALKELLRSCAHEA